MVPFPFAADDHQRKNAEAVERAGAGRVILQADLTPERLAQDCYGSRATRRQLRRMGEASQRLAQPDAAEKVVDLAMRIVVEWGVESGEWGIGKGTIPTPPLPIPHSP